MGFLFLFTFHQLVDAWRKFATSAWKTHCYGTIRIAGYRKIYLFEHKAQYVN